MYTLYTLAFVYWVLFSDWLVICLTALLVSLSVKYPNPGLHSAPGIGNVTCSEIYEFAPADDNGQRRQRRLGHEI